MHPNTSSASHTLPPLKANSALKNYYLAHSIDLSQPDFVHVNIQEGVPLSLTKKSKSPYKEILQIDAKVNNSMLDVLNEYDSPLQKNNQKITNRQISPEDLRESII